MNTALYWKMIKACYIYIKCLAYIYTFVAAKIILKTNGELERGFKSHKTHLTCYLPKTIIMV